MNNLMFRLISMGLAWPHSAHAWNIALIALIARLSASTPTPGLCCTPPRDEHQTFYSEALRRTDVQLLHLRAHKRYKMSFAPRQSIFPNSAASSLRQPSLGSSHAQSQQSTVLQARIASKRQELENLKQLKDLSGALANQIGALETKLSTLKDGTEAVACVLANWDNVLRAISMASSKNIVFYLRAVANLVCSESTTAVNH